MEKSVLMSIQNGIGIITLNRPSALNAINQEMVTQMKAVFNSLKSDRSVQVVILNGAGDKAFCAGGDIKAMYHAHYNGEDEALADFYRQEYQLNLQIALFPKPIIVFASGVCMGGGLGLTAFAPYRLVSENSLWAMPENAIGLYPDVGAGYFLNKCPGEIGLYLALTGVRMNASEALYTGLATHFAKLDTLELIRETLIQADTSLYPKEIVEEVLNIYGSAPDMPNHLHLNRASIDTCFDGGGVEDIVGALLQNKSKWAQDTLQILDKLSPTSLKVTYAYMKKCRGMPLEGVLDLNYQLSQKFMQGHDFYEGVRAMLIDKDKNPIWRPDTLDQVSINLVKEYIE